ncbi:MAG: hypothetical protein JO209_04400 [Acidisphaera sp.]|nr:hypothetical protein [Acidisphaera sp.]
MRIQTELASAKILPFPVQVEDDSRLTMRDRMAILAWQETARGQGYGRFLFSGGESLREPAGEYLSIYRDGEAWAAWCIAREGPWVHLWRCATGADLGEFRCMEDALAAIPPARPGADFRSRSA